MAATAVPVVRTGEEDAPQALVRRGKLSELAARLEHIRDSTTDIVADTRDLGVELYETAQPQTPGVAPNPWLVRLGVKGTANEWPLNHHAHTQLAEKVGIPYAYYDRMRRDAPQLYQKNVNHWLQEEPDRRLIRIAEGHVRAVLSDRYRVGLDNYSLAFQVAEQAQAHNATVLQCDLSETRMQIRIGVPGAREKLGAMTAEIRERYAHRNRVPPPADLDADYAVPGLLVTNSEVGAGAFRVEPYVMRLVCWNGMIGETSLYKVHVGAKMDLGEVTYRDDTLNTADELVQKQVRDLIESTFTPEVLHAQVQKFLGAKTVEIKKPVEVVDATTKYLRLSDKKREDLLRYFSQEGDTLFGLVNGVTRLAQDYEDPDQQSDYERAAGKILSQPALVGVEA